MTRLSQAQDGGTHYLVAAEHIQAQAAGYGGAAIERLAKFENAYEELLARQHRTAAELEQLKQQGKQKSVRFKELLSQKMINSMTLSLFETYGL